jgi:myosin V
MSESYEVGTRAWQPDSTEGWVPSEVEQKLVEGDKVRLVFRLNNGEVCTLAWGSLSGCSRMVSGQTGR